MFDKTDKVFIFNICYFYTTSVVMNLVSICYNSLQLFSIFLNGSRLPSWIFIFGNICQKLKLALISTSNLMKIGRSGAVFAYFRFLKWRPSAIRHLGVCMTP